MTVHVRGDHKIGQYDGNDDPDTESEVEQGPIEDMQSSKCGWFRTEAIKPNYPRGVRFWSDPNRPPEEIITAAPLPGTPQQVMAITTTAPNQNGKTRVAKK